MKVLRKGLMMTDVFSCGEDTNQLAANVVGRRRFLLGLFGSAAGLVSLPGVLAACSGSETPGASTTAATATTGASLVRLSSVVTPQDGGLYDDLLPDFERQTGYRVELTAQSDAYGPARAGQADVVISHYGHRDTQTFVQDGFGQWPQTVFSNQTALLGVSDDPARVRNLTDLVEAFRRIAQTQSPFIVNDSEGIKYLSEILWNNAGRPEKGKWYRDQGVQHQAAVTAAAEQGGYVLWGLTPFLTFQQQNPIELQPLVLNDPLLQRIMVSVGVDPDKVPGVNVTGAKAFQQYLLDPATQARIRAFRLPGIDQQIWWPAGRNNAGSVLPKL
jgi:tungstate transport system substrate-binding protein